METLRTTKQVREGVKNRKFPISDVIPVIVSITYKNHKDLALQFWSKEMIDRGELVNTDNTVSKFVELY